MGALLSVVWFLAASGSFLFTMQGTVSLQRQHVQRDCRCSCAVIWGEPQDFPPAVDVARSSGWFGDHAFICPLVSGSLEQRILQQRVNAAWDARLLSAGQGQTHPGLFGE